jgi:hypothetical protein
MENSEFFVIKSKNLHFIQNFLKDEAKAHIFHYLIALFLLILRPIAKNKPMIYIKESSLFESLINKFILKF